MKHFFILVFYALVTCETGILPHDVKVVLDRNNNHMDYTSDDLKTSGTAVHTDIRGIEYYQLNYGFNSGIQLMYDGEEWMMCNSPDGCLRCGQHLKL